ncbi:small-subunit processome [Calocera cornea HHB12733]|uniref:Small-subunit processome n=1 Tax=Calocera cornea HHB12733 TaxID=1353952 RepID=A0A165GBU4_9BASI|nr:small-subunit processome [Calocera cornea HHB12733]
MSSMRNAAPRRNHKERGQLANRQKLGLLEKHKDYILRARDYHAKKNKLTRLRVKASERNKDEFYFGMIKGRTEGGVHVQDRGNEALPVDVAKVLKSQDANYIRTQKAANLRRIEALKAQLTLLADLLPSQDGLTSQEMKTLQSAGLLASTPSNGKSKKPAGPKLSAGHVVFAENDEEAKSYQPPSAVVEELDMEDDDVPEFQFAPVPAADLESLGWLPPTPAKSKRRKSSSAADTRPATDDVIPATDEECRSHRSTLITELSARLLRNTQLRYALSELELQKVLMGKGGRQKMREAEEVKLDDADEKAGNEDEDEDAVERKKEEKLWRPRVFKWKFVRRK